jgi:hypothetical protein
VQVLYEFSVLSDINLEMELPTLWFTCWGTAGAFQYSYVLNNIYVI